MSYNVLTNWVIVACDDKVLVLPAAHRALVQWVNYAHISLLFEAQQSAFMKLNTLTTSRTYPYHRPYHQSYL